MTTRTEAVKISARTAKTTLPDGLTELAFRDTELTGFRLRITPRAKRYVFAGRVKGAGRRTVILGDADSMTATEARQRAMAVRTEFLTGTDSVAETKPDSITFGAVAKDYREKWMKGGLNRQKRAPAPRSVGSHDQDMKRGLLAFSDTPVNDIGLDAARTFTATLESEDISAAIQAKSWGAVSRIMDRAVTQGHADMNPFRAMPGFAGSAPRDRYLSENEVARVWAATGDMGRHDVFCRFMMSQPLRLSLGLGLDWRNVDLNDMTITIPGDAEGNKSRKPWRLPLSPIAADLLGDLHHPGATGLVFAGLTWKSFHMKKWIKLSGVTGWSIHDLRRTATSLPAERYENFDEDLADLWLMHLRTGIKGTYQSAARVEPMRMVARLWSEVLADVVKL